MQKQPPEASACNFIKKETQAQMFYSEFCEISKNIFSYRALLEACFCLCFAREKTNMRNSNQRQNFLDYAYYKIFRVILKNTTR